MVQAAKHGMSNNLQGVGGRQALDWIRQVLADALMRSGLIEI
jgi:hypothetical protein